MWSSKNSHIKQYGQHFIILYELINNPILFMSVFTLKGAADERLRVREWMDPGRTRPVIVNFGLTDSESITLVNRKNETLRKINLSTVDRLSVQITRDNEDSK